MIKSILPVFFLALPAIAFAATQSDTVPSSQLTAAFQVAPATAGNPQAEALVTLTRVTVANGQESDETLDQSSDDVVTFNVGQNSLTYNPATPSTNVLPYVGGATYTMSFKRFNGESYSGSVVMPGTTVLSTPTQNQVFKKTDTVNLAWNSVPSFEDLFVLSANCATIDLSGFAYNADYTAAVIPSGAADSCSGAVQLQFSALYVNGGTGFGSFAAASFGGVGFSYGADASMPKTLSLHGVRIDRLLAKARLTGNHTVRMSF